MWNWDVPTKFHPDDITVLFQKTKLYIALRCHSDCTKKPLYICISNVYTTVMILNRTLSKTTEFSILATVDTVQFTFRDYCPVMNIKKSS